MKKLINDANKVVEEMVAGLTLTYGGLQRLSDENVILRFDSDAVWATSVAVVSGGGSGHEPAHAGYVGAGMLSAVVLGDVFTSSGTDTILAAIHAVSGPAGTLLIIKNYTGDQLNFRLAAEIARAEGYKVEMAVVADDVSLPYAGKHAGRRGLAGTVLVHKVAGAAAAEALPLVDVAELARHAAARVGTMGSRSERARSQPLVLRTLLSPKPRWSLGWAFMANRGLNDVKSGPRMALSSAFREDPGGCSVLAR